MHKSFINILVLAAVAALIVPAIACGGGGGSTTTPPPVTTYTINVTSSNPDTNLAVTASPADNSGKTGGATSLSLTYNSGSVVTLTAPATSGANTFASWTGCATASTTTCTVSVTANTTVIASYTSPFPTAATNWVLDPTKSDEFNGGFGTAPDSAKWGYDTGGGGWGNNEMECYTSSTANSYHDGAGNLVIEALAVAQGSACGGQSYTSARLLSKGKFSQKYGRIEASMKLPSGTGIWPAFWLLGDNIDAVNWPACGEVDIMENVLTPPLGPNKVLSSLHATGFNTSGPPVDLGGNVDAAYHIYGMIWAPNMIQFYVDDYKSPFATFTPANMPQTGTWAFNHPFFIILNVAVGGNWPGSPDGTTFVTPQKMYVDYVRVYNAE